MPATLYLRPNPRAFLLLTPTHALIFRQPASHESKASRSVVVAEFLPIDEVDMRGLVRVGSGTVEGVLGVTSVPTERSPIPEVFLLLLTAASTLPPLLPNSHLRPARVLAVEFHSLSSSFFDPPDLTAAPSSGYNSDDELYDTTSTPTSSYASGGPSTSQSPAQQQGVPNPCSGMKKYLQSGGFFFADRCAWDISTRMGEDNWVRSEMGEAAHPLETFDERFVWNKSLLEPFLSFRLHLPVEVRAELDRQALLIPVIQGFCGSQPVSTGEWSEDGKPEVACLGMVSRLSWKRAGARFRTRGIDDDGQVANFVETELVLATDRVVMSYTQVRGSVPLFWQQPSAGLGTLQQRVEITRPPQATQPAFDKHFLSLLETYHSAHAVNLLGQKDAESMLSIAYSDHLAALQSTLDQTSLQEKENMDIATRGSLRLTAYDFHAAIKNGGGERVKADLAAGLRRERDEFGWTSVDRRTGEVVERQEGVFRVNCLDCLDRTNFVQDVLSTLTLTSFLNSIHSSLRNSPTLWAAHRELWADNGDRLSKIYAGTGAINTSATRSGKITLKGMLSDATKSVGRAYITNFQDKGKQNAIDMLLGMMAGQRPVILFDPISDSIQSALAARVNEYSETRNVSIFCGTWNLNGKAPDEALDSWLFPTNADDADIYMICFQEIVELTPGQILQTDPAKKRMWEKYIMDTFKLRGKGDYLLFRSEQLVGTSLIIIVRSELSKSIRNVESATKKTGLSGLSGNKGGVGIRLDLYDSSVCFMTCHLAAGHSNVAERNADYKTIVSGLKFLRGKTVEDHDIIIWGADFNYRITMPYAEVRECAETDQLDRLLVVDQLLQAMDDGEVFVGYDEGPISFRPTYKYDNGTDDYDTSEKQRIPAWTDRILFKSSALRLKEYYRAELCTSDHKPVYALFDATVRAVDRSKKDRIAKEIMHEIRSKEPADDGEKFDEKVEEGLAGSGRIKDLVQNMTKTSISPSISPKPYAIRDKSPRIPPRPTMVNATAEDSTLPPRRRSPMPAVRRDVKPPTRSFTNPMYDAQSLAAPSPVSGPPPLPRRASPAPSTSSIASASASRRAAPAVPARSALASNGTGIGTGRSPAVTSASTGDVGPSSPSSTRSRKSSAPPPPLPPRVAPVPRPSLDINGSPPAGLIPPVTPDTVRSSPPKKGKLPQWPPTAPPKDDTEAEPASEVQKVPPSPHSAKTVALSVGSSTRKPEPPAKPRRLSSAAAMAQPTSPTESIKKLPPPTVPKKPDTLRTISGTG